MQAVRRHYASHSPISVEMLAFLETAQKVIHHPHTSDDMKQRVQATHRHTLHSAAKQACVRSLVVLTANTSTANTAPAEESIQQNETEAWQIEKTAANKEENQKKEKKGGKKINFANILAEKPQVSDALPAL